MNVKERKKKKECVGDIAMVVRSDLKLWDGFIKRGNGLETAAKCGHSVRLVMDN